jgi:hypothetical protein
VNGVDSRQIDTVIALDESLGWRVECVAQPQSEMQRWQTRRAMLSIFPTIVILSFEALRAVQVVAERPGKQNEPTRLDSLALTIVVPSHFVQRLGEHLFISRKRQKPSKSA